MSKSLRIESSEDDTVLAISSIATNHDGSLRDYQVSVSKTGLDCSINVCGFMSDGFGEFLISLNREMEVSSGWTGSRSWASLEGEFELEAKSDSLGHTTIMTTLKSGHYEPDWELQIGLVLDASQLSTVASNAGAIFN